MQLYKPPLLFNGLIGNVKPHLLYLALVGVIGVFFSIGYLYPDEHFQIIEFANAAIGRGSFDKLAWEYGSRIRPWLQPWFAAIPLKLGFFVSDSPFVAIKFVKALSAFFVLVATSYFLRCGNYDVDGLNPKERQLGGVLLATSVLLSQMVASTNSEIFAAAWLMLLLGYTGRNFGPDRNEKSAQHFWCGCLNGVMFFSRFQMGFVYAALGFWLLVIRRSSLKHLSINVLGFLTASLAFVLLDSYMYGGFVVTPANYFHANIIEGVASRFGISPWYAYFFEFGTSGRLVGGFLSFATLTVMVFVRPKSLLTWIFWFFVFGHSVVAHKEERFLFPVLIVTPVCWPLMFGLVSKVVKKTDSGKVFWPVRVLVAVSCLFGLITAFRPRGQKYGVLEYLDSIGRAQHQAVCLDWDVKDQPKSGERVPIVPAFYQSPYVQVMFPQDLDHANKRTGGCADDPARQVWYTVKKTSPEVYFSSLKTSDASLTCQTTNNIDLVIVDLISSDRVHAFIHKTGVNGEQLYLWACRRT
jgi:phosphatidylinositol glycan class B